MSFPLLDDEFYWPEAPSYFSSDQDVYGLLLHASDLGAADLILTSDYYPVIDIHGKKKAVVDRTLEENEFDFIINRICGDGTLDVLAGGDSKEFSVAVPTGERHKERRFRGSAAPGLGQRITLRVIPEKIPTVDEIDMDEPIVRHVENFRKGLVMFIGQTGTGKSTSLASLIDHKLRMPQSNMNLLTFENPIEFILKQAEYPSSLVFQREIGSMCPSFSQGLKDSLRQTPTHTFIGEIRAYEEIQLALLAANLGQGLFCTTHATSVATAPRRLIAEFPQEQQPGAQMDFIEQASMLVAQELIPTIDNKRIGIREYLIPDREDKDFLLKSSDITSALRTVIKEKGQTFAQSSLARLKSGRISEQTHQRVLATFGE